MARVEKKSNGKKKAGGEKSEIQLIAKNRKAHFDYHVEEDIEAGMVLMGSEVKSLRDGRAQLVDAYAVVDRGEVFVHQLHISEYPNAVLFGHEPRRVRKLLLHKREIGKLARKVEEKGYTLIPLELYFRRGRVKVKLGLCRGKKEYDKRAAIKERDQQRYLRAEDE